MIDSVGAVSSQVSSTYSHLSKESIYRKKVEGWTFERIIKHIGLKWTK